MGNAAKAYLCTEGKMDYRDCQISYYTYAMFDAPNKYKINVNVNVLSTRSKITKTLAIDDTFDKESEAINFGISKGKAYVDQTYREGKLTIINPIIEKAKAKNDRLLLEKRKPEKPEKSDKK